MLPEVLSKMELGGKKGLMSNLLTLGCLNLPFLFGKLQSLPHI